MYCLSVMGDVCLSVCLSVRRGRHICLSLCVQVSDADMQSVAPQDATSATAANKAE